MAAFSRMCSAQIPVHYSSPLSTANDTTAKNFIDPRGAPNVAPEEVELMTYDENKLGLWTSFHLADEETKGTVLHQGIARIEHQNLDTTIEKNANLQGKASTTLVALQDGIRVIPFSLFPSLRVQSGRRPAAGFHSGGQERRRRF